MKRTVFALFVGAVLFHPCFVCAGRADDEKPDARVVKIASLSFEPVKWDKETNLARIEKMAREAARGGAKVLVTPEGAVDGYLINEVRQSKDRRAIDRRFFDIAEPIDGPAVRRVRKLARELEVDIILGFLERDGDVLYNACAWIDAEGEVRHTHRKTHMAQPYFDPDFYHPGYELKAFDTKYGRFGMMICYERQVPEVARALALDGATVLFNPSYGSTGEWNDIMLRTRARENGACLIFTHPHQSLIIDPEGRIIVNEANREGIAYAELALKDRTKSILSRRRPEAFLNNLARHSPGGNQRASSPGHIKIATVQLRSTRDIKTNVHSIRSHLARCASRGVRVVLFPECATTGYFKNDIENYKEQDFLDAHKAIGEACRENRIFCIVGTPYYSEGTLYNMALVINDRGETIYRQAKIQLVSGDDWAEKGNRLSVFRIDDHLCSLLICHDSRYPELIRLPVLKGARLVFYLSSESGIRQEKKIVPYRAQVVARAVENGVFIVQANTPQNTSPIEGSHGQSRIVDPNGTILQEASIFEEEVLIENLDLGRASASIPKNSFRADFLRDWWENGRELVGPPEQVDE